MNRKTLFGIITLVFALIIFSCDGFDAPLDHLDQEPMFTEDGTPMVTIDIDTNAINRALSEELARGGINFYEVTFRHTTAAGTRYYRASWPADRQGRVSIPVGVYDAPNDTYGTPSTSGNMAVIFAGREFAGTRSLLAVGRITQIRDINNAEQTPAPTTANADIRLDSRYIQFTLQAITNDIRTTRAHNTFLIRGPVPTPTGISYFTPVNLPQLDVGGGVMRPVFDIPIRTTGSANVGDNATNLSAVYGIRVPLSSAVMMLMASGTTELGRNYFITTGFSNGIDIGVVVPTGRAYRIGFTVGATPSFGTATYGEFTATENMIPSLTQGTGNGFMIPLDTSSTSLNPGLSMLRMNIPVRAIGGDVNSPGITWYIQGGFNNLEFDAASGTGTTQSDDNNSLGGAILLGVGPYRSRVFIIEPDGP
ncbi:MAG: hypothetical protein FWG77_08350 [Treponema sp.]|nr:hypothetical protein [Treponema sp.]